MSEDEKDKEITRLQTKIGRLEEELLTLLDELADLRQTYEQLRWSGL